VTERTPPNDSERWKRHTRLHYDRVAEEYVETYYADLTDAPWLDRFRAALRPTQASVLDAGCGPGHFSVYLRDHRCEIVGIDGSPGMIDAARRLTPGADFRVMDFTALEFETESFDGVLCAYALLHLPTEAASAALAEFRRVLRADGVLALMVKEGRGAYITDSPLIESETCYVQLWDPSEALGLLDSAGFNVIHTDSAAAGARELQFRKLFFLAASSDTFPNND
jgi:ubiquinone/menaquinone biosynthesis C-methylase UbiE